MLNHPAVHNYSQGILSFINSIVNMIFTPMKYYSIKQMVLPDHTLGKEYALLNQLRTSIREVEVSAAVAFKIKGGYERKDIIEGLNRLSSAIHVMMCMYLAGDYQTM